MSDTSEKWRLLALTHALILSLLISPKMTAQDTSETQVSETSNSVPELNVEANSNPNSDPATEQETSPSTAQSESNRVKSAPQHTIKEAILVKDQYPANELIELSADGTPFNALWRLSQSGEAFGAVLILPTRGQHADWPNALDIMRRELSNNGWNTLAIEVENTQNFNRDPSDALPESSDNSARLESAIRFLQSEGQFNIVALSYGASAGDALRYASRTKAPGFDSEDPNGNRGVSSPLRGLVFIGALSYRGERLSTKLSAVPYKEMPVLDIITGTHYLDTFDAKERKAQSRIAGFENYVQIKSIKPTLGSKVFGKENRLSRRVRGFLEAHAKGVEVKQSR